MALSATFFTERIAAVFDTLSPTEVVDTVTAYQSDGTTSRGSFDMVRASQLKADEIQDTGFETQYRFSGFGLSADAVAAAVVDGDVIVTESAERLRVLRTGKGPGGIYIRFDLGDEWQGDV